MKNGLLKLTVLSLGFLLLLSHVTNAAITVNDSGKLACTSSCSTTVTLSVGTDYLAVTSHIDDNGDIEDCIWNGVTMTNEVSCTFGNAEGIINSDGSPTTGAHTLSCSGTGFTSRQTMWWLGLQGVSDEVAEDTCTATDVQTCTITTVSSGSMVVGELAVDRNVATIVAGAGQTDVAAAEVDALASYGIDDATHSYTAGAGAECIVAASFKEAVTATARRRIIISTEN